MSREKSRDAPRYLHHRTKGQAFVYLYDETGRRRQVYLGAYDSPESRRRYREILAQYFGDPPAPVERGAVRRRGRSLTELIALFIDYATSYYVNPDGSASREVANLKDALKLVHETYGDLPVEEFGPLALEQVRRVMIAAGLSRKTINDRVNRIRRMFKWAVSRELIPPSIHEGLRALGGLRGGRSQAKPPRKVEPVSKADFDAILPFVSEQIGAMMMIQWWTGCRPGEACQMRGCDLDTSRKIWTYTPATHKTARFGKSRRILLGPKGQEVLRPFLKVGKAFLFVPREAEEARRQDRRAARKTPLWPSHELALERKRKSSPLLRRSEYYSTQVYARAIARACSKAGVAHFSPNQIRHTAATRIRKECGLEAARVVLGHSSATTSEIYAEIDEQKAIEVMARMG